MFIHCPVCACEDRGENWASCGACFDRVAEGECPDGSGAEFFGDRSNRPAA